MADLCASDGTQLGWVIEPLALLTDTGDRMATDEVRLGVRPDASIAEFERALYGRDIHSSSSGDGLAGMWVAILLADRENVPIRRVYLGGIHSVIYSVDHRLVATSHSLIPEIRRDEVLSRAFDPLRTSGYYTFGLTAFRGVSRLLPNHYLDLDAFAPVRHWPLYPLEPLRHGVDGAVAVVEHSRRLVRVLAAAHPSFRVFLSAGRDSRAILALLRRRCSGFPRSTARPACSSTIWWPMRGPSCSTCPSTRPPACCGWHAR